MEEYQSLEKKLSDVKEILDRNYTRHEEQIEKLKDAYSKDYHQWMFYLKENFNLLVYGIGSKTKVIERFCSTMLEECCVLTVKGFNPTLSLREVVRSLVVDVFGKTRCPVNVDEAFLCLKNLLKQSKFPVFVIVYNIDGIALRALKRQEVLSKLASIPKLHLIATVDHINSPLLWSEKMMSRFNFIWIEVVTYQPYLYETWSKHVSGTESSEFEDHDYSVFLRIYKCSSDKVKKLAQIIVEDRLKNKHHEQNGISLQDLHARAKEEMLLGQQHLKTVNNLLKDFYEHNVIRKTASNCVILNVKKSALSKFDELKLNEDE